MLLKAAAQQEQMAQAASGQMKAELLQQARESRALAERRLALAPDSAPSTQMVQSELPGASSLQPPQPPQQAQPSPSDLPDRDRSRALSDEASSHRSAAATLLKAATQQEQMAGAASGQMHAELLQQARESRELAERKLALAEEKERASQLLARSPPKQVKVDQAAAAAAVAAVAAEAGPSQPGSEGMTRERALKAAGLMLLASPLVPGGLLAGAAVATAAPYLGIGGTSARRLVGATLRRDGAGRFLLQLRADAFGVFIATLGTTTRATISGGDATGGDGPWDERARLRVGDYLCSVDGRAVWARGSDSAAAGAAAGAGAEAVAAGAGADAVADAAAAQSVAAPSAGGGDGGGQGGDAELADGASAVGSAAAAAGVALLTLSDVRGYVRDAAGDAIRLEVYREELQPLGERLGEVTRDLQGEARFYLEYTREQVVPAAREQAARGGRWLQAEAAPQLGRLQSQLQSEVAPHLARIRTEAAGRLDRLQQQAAPHIAQLQSEAATQLGRLQLEAAPHLERMGELLAEKVNVGSRGDDFARFAIHDGHVGDDDEGGSSWAPPPTERGSSRREVQVPDLIQLDDT